MQKYQRQAYKRPSISFEQQQFLIRLNNESVGIRSIGRLLKIAVSSVVKYLNLLSCGLKKRELPPKGGCYEIDELQTYIVENEPSNYVWITYAIDRESRRAVDFVVGKRTKENLKMVVDKVQALTPEYIYTDGLNIYRGLIGKSIHKVQRLKSTILKART